MNIRREARDLTTQLIDSATGDVVEFKNPQTGKRSGLIAEVLGYERRSLPQIGYDGDESFFQSGVRVKPLSPKSLRDLRVEIVFPIGTEVINLGEGIKPVHYRRPLKTLPGLAGRTLVPGVEADPNPNRKGPNTLVPGTR